MYIDYTNNGYSENAGDGNFGVILATMALNIKTVVNLPSFISSARFGFGLGLIDNGYLMKINEIHPESHNFINYGRDSQVLQAKFGLGFGFFEDLFGVGIGVAAYSEGHANANLGDIDINDATVGEPIVAEKIEMNMKFKPTVLAGLYLNFATFAPFLEGLSLGASYRQESAVSIQPFEAKANLTGTTYQLNLLLSIFEYYSPHVLVVGFGYSAGRFKISADVECQLWSKYKVSLGIDESQSADEGGYQLPEAKNVWVVKLGMDTRILDWFSILSGIYYQPAVFAEDEMDDSVNYLDNDKVVGSVGLKFRVPSILILKGPIEIITTYQFQYLFERNTNKADPADDYRYGGIIHTFMLGISLKV